VANAPIALSQRHISKTKEQERVVQKQNTLTNVNTLNKMLGIMNCLKSVQ